MSVEDGKEKLSHVGDVGWGLIKIHGTWDLNEQATLKAKLEKLVDINQVLKSETSIILSSGDPEIIKGLTECIHLHGGLAMSLTGRGQDLALLEMEYTPFPGAGHENDATLSGDLTVVNGKIEGGSKYAQDKANLGPRILRDVILKRDPLKDLLVAVNTVNAGAADAYLPPSKLPFDAMAFLTSGYFCYSMNPSTTFIAVPSGGNNIQLTHHNYKNNASDSSTWRVVGGDSKRFKIIDDKTGTYYEYSGTDDNTTIVYIGTNDPNPFDVTKPGFVVHRRYDAWIEETRDGLAVTICLPWVKDEPSAWPW